MAHVVANWFLQPLRGTRAFCEQARRSLQFKASVLVVLVVLLVTGFGTALGLRGMNAVLYENESVRAQEWASSLASNAAADVSRRDAERLRQQAEALVRTHGVAYVVFADAQRRILASAESAPGLLVSFLQNDGRTMNSHEIQRPALVQFPRQNLCCVDVLVPVYEKRGNRPVGLLGYMRFAADISSTQAKLVAVARQLSRAAFLLVLLLVPCSLLVMRHVVAPIKELANAAHAFANGSMEARARVTRCDEIGELADSFNRMANRVAESQHQLMKLNAELEDRVRQRTHELQELAARDPLTGLYNRRYFGEVIAREFAAAERYEDDLAVLMFDLDHFKQVNDRFGHRTGDEILIMLARAIAGELRGSDVAARFGGDELILMLPQTSSSSAMSLADRVIQKFADEVSESRPGVAPTFSVGVASLRTTRAPSSEALVQEADVALYAAKEAGRNRTMVAGALASA